MQTLRYLIIVLIMLTSFSALKSQSNYENAVEIFKQANLLKQQNKFNESAQKYSECAKIFYDEGYSGNYIQSKYSEGEIYLQQNKFTEAENIFNDIDTFSVAKYGVDNKFQVNILFGKGKVAFYKNLTDKALEYYLKSLELNTKFNGTNNQFESVLYSSIGNVYSLKGQYNMAISYFEKDLELKNSLQGINPISSAISYNNLGLAYKGVGNFDKALEYFNKAIDISSKINGGYNADNANFLGSKSNIFFEKGQFDLALDFGNRALEINKTIFGDKHKSVADNLNSIGIILNKQGKPAEALVYFKDAYEIQKVVLGNEHPEIAMTCNNIGYILQDQGKYESALSYYNEAVRLKTKYFGENHPELAVYYNNIGINYFNRGLFEQALQSYEKAETISVNTYGNKFPLLVKIYANIADIYRSKQMYYKSLEYYQKSLSANVQDFNPPEGDFYTNPPVKNYLDLERMLIALEGKANVLTSLYLTDSAQANIENSYKTYIICDSVITIYNKTALKESDKISLNSRTKIIYEDAIVTSMEMSYAETDPKQKQKYISKAFYFSEKNKAGVLSQAIDASSAKKFAGVPDEILEKEKFYKEQIAELEKKIIESTDNATKSVFKNVLFDYNNKLIDLNREIENKFPKYFESKYKEKVFDLSDIQKYLDKNSAVRSYFDAREQIIIFTVTKENINVYSVPKPSDFNDKVKNLIKYTTSGLKSEFPKYAESAYEMYEILFPDSIPAEISKLTVISDGIIGLVPFDALFTKKYSGDIMIFKNYPVLIKKYQTNYFYSASLLIKNKEKSAQISVNSLLGLAPVFEDTQNLVFSGFEASYLPGSEKEMLNIEEIFSYKQLNINALYKNAATEKYIKTNNLKDYKFIHIATHGIVNTEFPELSGLLLYPEKGVDDNILYSGEIYNLDLNADLVVLSACQTGIGKISKSEGIIGLSRSLLYAGANNVIVSLWKVSDASTTNLMTDFYKNVIDYNFTYSEALHNAKLKMINEGGTTAHPFFWSAFVLIGN